MRVRVDIESGAGGHDLVVTVDEEYVPYFANDRDYPYTQPVTWLPGGHLLVAAGAEGTVADAAGLARAVECCDADDDEGAQLEQLEQLKQYGRLLFEAAFGEDTWQTILRAAAVAGARYLEVAIRGSAHGQNAMLQALRWEALHDGKRFIAAQGTSDEAFPVGVVRLITPTATTGGASAGTGAFRRIEHIPRVLFAVGSYLADQDIRAGTEFMGIMRRLDRKAGSVQARVLDSATDAKLRAALRTFKPDVLHLIGHGKAFREEGVKVQLRGESQGVTWVSARQLLSAFAEEEQRPAMVVLSACHTADAASDPVSALPFAAHLVAGDGVDAGVPVVVAMAGAISDLACRLFTQALTTAIGEGEPLGKAVIRGRRAAFFGGSGAAGPDPVPRSGHWVMPAMFLAEDVPDGARLVNTVRLAAARDRIHGLRMDARSVFCGRAAFITALDRLLDPGDPLKVLVASTPDANANFGGKRLLRELGARAVRCDVLPLLLGPFKSKADSPKDPVGLATALESCFAEMRGNVAGFRRGPLPGNAVAAARAEADRLTLATAIREDLEALVADLPDDDPVRCREEGQPRTILLCHRVHWWGAFSDLAGLLGPNGLNMGTTPVPVVMTAAEGPRLQAAREGEWADQTWIDYLPLGRLSKEADASGRLLDEADRDEDILAYQWWLLNPYPGDETQKVYALSRRPSPDWRDNIREHLASAPVYPAGKLFAVAKAMHASFAPGDDDELLRRYARVLQ